MSTVTMPKQTARDTQQFESLFREHHALVYGTAYVLTGSSEDAKDVLQTIFLRLLQRDVPLDSSKNLTGYFYRAAVNLSLNTIHARRREVLTADFTKIETPCPDENNDKQETIERRLIEKLTTLPPRTVEILTLRYVHDYTEAEIAKLLQRSRGTIAVTLFRARARLRKLLRTSSGENV